MKLFNLNANARDLPEAMAKATRIGRIHGMERRPKMSSVRAVSDLVAPGVRIVVASPDEEKTSRGRAREIM